MVWVDEVMGSSVRFFEGQIGECQRAVIQHAMGRNKQRDEENRQLQQSEQFKPLLSLYIQDTVRMNETRDSTRLKKMAVPYLEQKTREEQFSSPCR